MLTLEKLKHITPGEIFATGFIKNNPEGFFVTRENPDREILWLAVRGKGVPDWCIYYGWAEFQEGDFGVPTGLSKILTNGDKVMNKEIIRKMVICDDESFKMYRY